jgi:metal-dependent HD superfamily phosphatase/phosphodiesterase
MQNPFETGHIRNYILLYASVVVIMILFFLATTIFQKDEKIEKKVFNTVIQEKVALKPEVQKKVTTPKFKLLERAY